MIPLFIILEVQVRIELTYNSFADCPVTTPGIAP
jgi:hypothetical protein